ncbi:MAG TPA: hypothetical protein VK112_13260 [Fodinibius sp.]|nr:hypothetical protein [Fodinibius sp.]
MADFIYHYTDIDTLALILENKKIRFNRLDRVDDVSESQGFKKLKLAQSFFVSCWTFEKEESIPQWHMYTNQMTGVRIKLPKKLFATRKLDIPEANKPFIEENLHSPIPYNRIFGDQHFILPSFLSEEHFERIVEYDEEFIKKK